MSSFRRAMRRAASAQQSASLLAQDYAGRFRVILVDDNSTDGTADMAGAAAQLSVIRLQSKPAGWSGKLWALSQGVAASTAPVLLFTDADIVHDPRHLSSLAAKLLQTPVDMVSEMVRLNCTSAAERALVPAFVYFFQMLYPFDRVNDPSSRIAAAAGGTVLIRRDALQRIGGIDSIKDSLIDDVALAKLVKKTGSIFLGHSGLASSRARLSQVWRYLADDFAHRIYAIALFRAPVGAHAGGTVAGVAGPRRRNSPRPWLARGLRSSRLWPWRAELSAHSGPL